MSKINVAVLSFNKSLHVQLADAEANINIRRRDRMTTSGSKSSWLAALKGLALSVAALLTMLGSGDVWAHVRPALCTGTGLAFGVTVFRADGVTPIVQNGQVSPCETIVYKASVGARSATFNDCDFEGGSIIIQTPDGVLHNV